ncbi:hypothetical protein [uncultured Clostridium sp.]|uniref:hypothetical protein n=1 Tax=uncultured Clostridium sp. TaxID=59620 RepID=UPI0032172D50
MQKEISKSMMIHTTKVGVSKINENINLNMEGLTFAKCVIRITQMVTFYKKEDIKKQLFDEYKKHPISHMFSKNLINNTGQTLLTLPPLDWGNPEKDQILLDMHIYQKNVTISEYYRRLLYGICFISYKRFA